MTAASIRRKLPVAGIAALAFAIPAGAQASTVHCGETVRKDVTLKWDLDCSTGGTGGLVVGKDGITIDLGGNSIIGAGGLDGYEGVENEGFGDVTITNGTVKRFQDDILLNNAVNNTVDHVKLNNNSLGSYNGIYSTVGSGNEFTNDTIKNSLYGIYLAKGGGNTVANDFFRNATNGVYTSYESHDRVVDSTSAGFSITTYGFNSQHDRSNVYRRDVANGGYTGFELFGANGDVVNRATANENGFAGIYVEGNSPGGGALIKNSSAKDNAEYGMYAAFGIPSRHNVATGNDFYNCYQVNCNRTPVGSTG